MVENGEVIISALVTEKQYHVVFTDNPPVELELRGVRYVPEKIFFNEIFPVELVVGNKKIATMTVLDDAHAHTTLNDDAIASLKRASRVQFRFANSFVGKNQRASFSLMGFSAALDTLSPSREVAAPSHDDPVSVVVRHLKADINLDHGNLETRDNPWGRGAFVYAPLFELAGYAQKCIWFVNGDQAVALNACGKRRAPSLPFPNDVSYKLWRDTGVTRDDVTPRGLELIFKN